MCELLTIVGCSAVCDGAKYVMASNSSGQQVEKASEKLNNSRVLLDNWSLLHVASDERDWQGLKFAVWYLVACKHSESLQNHILRETLVTMPLHGL
jgi:hypothetical protein